MKKRIIKTICYILAIVLIVDWLISRDGVDIVGFSSTELKIINFTEFIGYIIIPIIISVLLLIRKEKQCLICLAIRSGTSIVLYLVYLLENSFSSEMALLIIFEVLYIVIILFVFFTRKINIPIIAMICAIRVVILLLSGNLSLIVYALNNGITNLMITGLLIISSELIMVLPVLSLDIKNDKKHMLDKSVYEK